MQKLNWQTLSCCHDHWKAITMFKIIYNLIAIPADIYFKPATTVYRTQGRSMKLKQPTTRIDSYLHSFFPSSIRIWNSLPEDVISSTTLA